jgi:hypothetical protein
MPLPKLEWSKIELFAVYITVGAYTAAKVVTTISPKAKQFLPDEAQVFILGAAILSTLIFLVKQLDRLGLRTQQPVVHPSFNEAFHAWLDQGNKLDSLLICAYTSHTFRESLWARNTQINTVRLLLFHESTGYPTASGVPDQSIADLQTNIGHWKLMVTDGRIKNLEIRRRPTNASFFFGIADRKVMIEGLLWPRIGMGGLEPQQVTTLGSETSAMRERIANYAAWFEAKWAVAEKTQP